MHRMSRGGYDDKDDDDDQDHDDDQAMAMMMKMAIMTTLTTTALITFSEPHVCVLCGWARSGRAFGSSAKEAN